MISKYGLLVCTAVSLAAMAAQCVGASAQEIDTARLQRVPEVRAAISACMGDRDRLCSDVAPGGGRVVRCLAGKADRLSANCSSAMEKASAALVAAGIAIQPNFPGK